MQFLANMVGVQVPEFPKPGKLHDPTSDADAQLKAFRLVQAALRAQVTNTTAVDAVAKPEPRGERRFPGVHIDGKEPVLFAMVRPKDETGVSGTGHVLDGVIWPGSGRVQVQWRSDTSSLNTYECYEDFLKVHVDSHPANETMILFDPQAHDDPRFYSGALPPKAGATTKPAADPEEPKTDVQLRIERVLNDVHSGKSVPREGPRTLKAPADSDTEDVENDVPLVYKGRPAMEVAKQLAPSGKEASTYEYVDEAAGSWPVSGDPTASGDDG